MKTKNLKKSFLKGVATVWCTCSFLLLQPAMAQREAGLGETASQEPKAVKALVKDFQLTAKLEGLTDHVYGLALQLKGVKRYTQNQKLSFLVHSQTLGLTRNEIVFQMKRDEPLCQVTSLLCMRLPC